MDRVGYRRCVLVAHALAALGLAMLAFLPAVLSFGGIFLSVMVYAVSSGLIEVLISPIVEACPLRTRRAG